MKEQVARVWLYKTDSLAVLLQKRSPFIRNAGKYDASAGGHLDGKESPEDAVIRECKEEIGINISKDKLILFDTSSNEYTDFTDFIYDCSGQPETWHLDPQEVSEVCWVKYDELEDFFKEKVKDTLAKEYPGFVKKLKEALSRHGNN